jgi:pyruvate dehydrogenase E1 component
MTKYICTLGDTHELARQHDPDPQETQEWRDALIVDKEGAERAHFLIEDMIEQAREQGIDLPYSATTEYINTIPVDQQPKYPGNPDMEIRFTTTSAGTPWPWSCAPTRHQRRRPHRLLRLAAALYDVGFRISGARLPRTTAAT